MSLRKFRAAVVLVGLISIVVAHVHISSAREIADPPDGIVDTLLNESFEGTDDAGFPAGNHRKIGDGLVYVDRDVSRSGGGSLYIGKSGGDANGFGINTSLTRPLLAGETYRVTVWYRAPEMIESNSGQVPFYLRLALTGGIVWNTGWVHPADPDLNYDITVSNRLVYVRPLPSLAQRPDEWHSLTATITIPDDGQLDNSSLIMNLYNESKDHPVWFDDISLQRVDDVTEKESGEKPRAQNLLANSGFEQGMGQWKRTFASHGAEHHIDQDVSFSGNSSLRLSGTRDTDRGAVSQTIPVHPGEVYEFGFVRKLENVEGGGNASSVRLHFVDTDDASRSVSEITYYGGKTGTQDWTKETFKVIVSSGVSKVHFQIFMDKGKGAAWWDDVYFTLSEPDPRAEEIREIPATFYISPDGDDHAAGTRQAPWKTVAHASIRAIAGDTIILLPGDYEGVLRPVQSGTPELPITFRAMERRTARLIGTNGSAHAVQLHDVSHIVVEGIHIRPMSDQGRWLLIDNSDHIWITDVLMEEGRGSMPFLLTGSEHVHIRDSVIRKYAGGNMARISHSNHVLFEGNSISRAGHSPFQFYPEGSNRYIIVRGNVFHAAWGRSFEFFPGTQDVLFEHNIVTNAFDSGRSTSSNAKFAPDRGIFRFNRVFRNWGGPIHLYRFADGLWLRHIRLYHNIFDDNVDYGLAASSGEDLLFLNNAFSRNDKYGLGRQIRVGTRNADVVRLVYNAIPTQHAGGKGAIDYSGIHTSVAGVQGEGFLRPADQGQFAHNIDADPQFVDAAIYNHALSPDSALLNAGGHLTTAVGDGDGRVITVHDAAYFFDGYGIAGEKGDLIAIGSTEQRARIVHVDYSLNELTLDTDVQWNDGDPVSFPWHGDSPDIGVYEHGLDGRPSVQVIAKPFMALPGENVRLKVTLHGQIDEPAEIRWQLGDGSIAFGSEISHRYDEAYDYPVRVRVATSSGDVYRGTGYVVVEEPRADSRPLLHSTFDVDDEDWWWYWKAYVPAPTEWGQELDRTTGNGVLRLANPGGGTMPLRVAPADWNIDQYPWIFLRYKVTPGTPIGIYLDTFQGTEGLSNKVWIASSVRGRMTREGQSALYELIDDGEWHTLLMDARVMRETRPDAVMLRRLGFETLGYSRQGDTYWLDEAAILPESAFDERPWNDTLNTAQTGHIQLEFPGDREIVRGEIVPGFSVVRYDHPGEKVQPGLIVQKVSMKIDDQPVLTTRDMREVGDVRIDTLNLSEGDHRLFIEVTDEGGDRMIKDSTFAVRNWRTFKDPLKAPDEVNFFGDVVVVDHSLTTAESDGWAYSRDLSDPVFQGVTGIVKATSDDEYLTWEAPGLRGFEVVAHIKGPHLVQGVETMVEIAQGDWIPLPHTPDVLQTREDGWTKVIVRGIGPEEGGATSFQLKVGSSIGAMRFRIEHVELDVRTF